MLIFQANDIDELQVEMNERGTEVSIAILTMVCDSLENDVDIAEIAYIPALDMEISVKKPHFKDALLINLARCEEAEEYELCQKATSWIEKLKD